MAETILLTGATGLIGFRILVTALSAGHKVRFTALSENAVQTVLTNPTVRELSLGDLLKPVIIPDFTAEGAFDAALDGITHIIHAASPVPTATGNPMTSIFQPTLKISSSLLNSALKTPSVQRVVITSSFVGNVGLTTPTTTVSGTTRVPVPDPLPASFKDNYEAYALSKVVELHNTDAFIKTRNPHFTVARIYPGYVFGRNDLALDADMMRTQNSSNTFLMMSILGDELPFPIQGAVAHLQDVADLHLRLAFLESWDGPWNFGIANEVDYADIWGYVERAFPKAVAADVLKKGKIPTVPDVIEYDCGDAERLLGGKFRSFECAVLEVAGQYLDKLGVERA